MHLYCLLSAIFPNYHRRQCMSFGTPFFKALIMELKECLLDVRCTSSQEAVWSRYLLSFRLPVYSKLLSLLSGIPK